MQHRPNELRSDLLSTIGLNPFPGHVSSPRAQMFSSHITQSLVINGSTERRLQTGVERELAKYTFSIKMPANGRILKVIERYPKDLSNNIAFNPETLVVYEDTETQEVGSFTIPTYASYHQHFGFEYAFKPAMSRLVPGNYIEKDTIFADSPSVTEDGGYKYGIELNLMFTSSHSAAEDGILISRDVLDKLKFKVFETRTVQFGNHNYPINLYGTPDNYKPFPEIGEYIRPDGLLVMTRDHSKALAPVESSIYDLLTPDYSFDKATYTRAGAGRVIDIKVTHNQDVVSTTPIGMEVMLNKYISQTRRFNKELVALNKDLAINRYKKHGKNSKVRYKPELHRLIVTSMALLDDANGSGDSFSNIKQSQKLNYLFRKVPIDDYHVQITVAYEITPDLGFKLTCAYGGKGVITKIEEPENMPIDADGNRADIVMDDCSVVKRMNIGRLYEHYISGACRDVQKKMKSMLGFDRNQYINEYKVNEVLSADSVLANSIYDYLLGFYKICSPKQYEYCLNAGIDDRSSHLISSIVKGVYLYMPTDNAPETTDIVRQLEKSYPSTYGQVSYVSNGTRVTTVNKARIAPLYMLLLEKIGDEWSSVSSAKLHHFGVLSRRTKSDKYNKPYKHSPVKTVGETEARIYLSYTGRESAAEVMDRSNSPATHRHIVESILKADTPTNIENAVDRSKVPLGNSKALQLVKHILMCSGIKMVYKPANT